MSKGKETRYAPHGVKQYPVPRREQILDHDYFYPCQRCGDPWPRTKLLREPVTNLLVCKNDYDIPSVSDVANRQVNERFFDRFDRLGHNLDEVE